MNDNYITKYCELIIKTGVNLYKGQCLIIFCGTKEMDFATKLAETAYVNGAKFVEIVLRSSGLSKFRIDNSSIADLQFVPNFIYPRSFEIISNDWAYVGIDNLEEIDIMQNSDPEKVSILSKKDQEKNTAISNAIMFSKIAWCLVATPGPVWAAKVFNEKPDEKLTEKLWEKLIKVLRLDKADPSAEWKANGNKLIKRSRVLNEMKLDKLIFTGPGTELEIGLNPNSVWRGGLVKAQNGRYFIPNIPTEEVFTTPDYKRTKGKVRITKPVKVMENLLTDISFEFKDGKVTDYDAKPSKEILKKYFGIDEGASYLGEVALVDKHSEVHKSGLIFNSILYDENAACHIALGRGIPFCFSNSEELLTPEIMKKNGCNYSLMHTDFMIGSDEINVTGISVDGMKHEIICKGEFVI